MENILNQSIHESAIRSVEILKSCHDVIKDKQLKKIDFVYEPSETANLKRIRSSVRIDTKELEKDELKLIIKLLKWATDNFNSQGISLNDQRYDHSDWFEIVKRSRCDGYSLNCRYKSLLFTQLLLSYGIKSRWVSCLPIPSITNERHCVTEAFVNKLNKWIVVDCAFNLIYFDNKGNLLNLIEMRKKIIADEQIRFFISDKNYVSYVYDCWKNHIFTFKYAIYNGYNMFFPSKKSFAYLIPSLPDIDWNKHNFVFDEDGQLYYNEHLFY